jgi:hypothetical protein
MDAGAEADAGPELVKTFSYFRVHYPGSFDAQGKATDVQLARTSGPEEELRLDVSGNAHDDLQTWTKVVVENESPWRKKVSFIETSQAPGKCHGENGTVIVGQYQRDGVPRVRFECTFLHAGYGYWFSYSLPASEQERDEPLLRQILDASELLDPPKRRDTTPSASSTPLSIPNADRVVAALRPRFKQCYQVALAKDPAMQGRTIIVAKVAPNGSVVSAEPSQTTGLSDELTRCIANVVQHAVFDPPGGSDSLPLQIPVNYVQQ